MTRIALWTAALAGLLGCQSGGGSSAPAAAGPSTVQDVDALPEMVALARPPIADLPVPVGFHLQEDKSRSFEAAGMRYIDHLYYGHGDRFAVKRFYERQMPISRWVLVTDMFIRGSVMMDFEKGSERCQISINSTGWFNGLKIQIAVWTSGPIRADRGTKE